MNEQKGERGTHIHFCARSRSKLTGDGLKNMVDNGSLEFFLKIRNRQKFK